EAEIQTPLDLMECDPARKKFPGIVEHVCILHRRREDDGAFFPFFNGFSHNFSLCCPVSYDPGLDYSRSDGVNRLAGQYRGSSCLGVEKREGTSDLEEMNQLSVLTKTDVETWEKEGKWDWEWA
ncbi:hypothetical protein IRJ41_015378, partial [Triplophysa rosa]